MKRNPHIIVQQVCPMKKIKGTIYLTSQKYLQYALCLLNCLHERRLEPL